MADGHDDNPGKSASQHRSKTKTSLANAQRLAALGEAINQKNDDASRRRKNRPHRARRRVVIGLATLVILVVVVLGGGYLYANWRFDQITKITVRHEGPKPISGQPFNILMIGSDSRAGLTGILAKQTGATTTPGQRSDVVKIVHIDPDAGTISMVSIPRDTVVTLMANQSLYGQFNRINVNFGNGPSLLVQTITANFGIPINQTIVVSFAGLINAADALGGVHLDFRYPSRDPYSGLNLPNPGCQLIEGFQALAVVRSRHMYYNVKGLRYWPRDATGTALLNDPSIDAEVSNDGWDYDPTSDFGRIIRQGDFLRAMVDDAKKLYDPVTINKFLGKLPQGVTLDSNFSLHELIGLAARFHGIDSNAIRTYTLPTLSTDNANLGDVLFVDQPAAQKLFVQIFGNELKKPTNPPPNESLKTPMPLVITTTTTPSHPAHKKTSTSTTTTTNPTLSQPNFDPTPC